MRVFACVVLLVASVHAGPTAYGDSSTDWPKGERLQLHDTDPPDDPPLAVFATRTSFFLMRLGDDGAPRCEEWATRPNGSKDPNHGRLVHGALAVDYHSSGLRLQTCGYSALVREEAAGNELDLDGTRWFRDPQNCKAAIAKHRMVATDFHSCLTPPPSAKAIEASRARFRTVFGKGGTLWFRDDNDCRVARAVPDRETETGKLVMDAHDGPSEWTFRTDWLGSDQLLDMDGDSIGPELGDGTITISNTVFYMAEAGCRTVIAVEQRRASWLPPSSP